MFVLGAPTVADHDHCAAHPCADAQSRNTGGSSSLWDGTNQGLLGKGLVRTALWAVRSTGRRSGRGWPRGGGRARLPCAPSQRSQFRNWHETDMPKYLGDVRCWVNSRKHVLTASFSGFDPTATLAATRVHALYHM